MLITGYDIALRRLMADDIEMVRQWRNSMQVSAYMEYREPISAEQQREWFRNIDQVQHNYFLILQNEVPAGLIYGSEIDWEKGITGNSGIFMGDERYFATELPLRAAFLLTDTGIALGQKWNYIKVLRDNQRAIFFNKKLGYRLLPDQEKIYNQRYVLDTAEYLEKTRSLKKALGHVHEQIEIFLPDLQHPAHLNMYRQWRKTPSHPQIPLRILLPDEQK
jgi:RimJ/RimL family protein N-acetyltransferase